MANNVPQPPASSAAKRRVYSVQLATFLMGFSVGLRLAQTLGDTSGLVSGALLGLALLITIVAALRWPDPL